METSRDNIKILLKYALAAAGLEDPGNQELGPIHLIKYVYLGDLAYAERHKGETFTKTKWIFYHYGPWSNEVYSQIEPALAEIGVEKRAIQSPKFDNDIVRYRIQDKELFETFDAILPIEISREMKWAVHQFGSDTSTLLHHVYKTFPMLCAAPNEVLSFSRPESLNVDNECHETQSGFVHQTTSKKERKKIIASLKERVKQKLESHIQGESLTPIPAPRYDQVYYEGMAWLDELAGQPIEEEHGELSISEDVWKSPARCESDVP